MIREVIDSLETREMEVRDHDGRTYSLRIRPYRTRDNRIDGAVVTLFDIDAIKRGKTGSTGTSDQSQGLPDMFPEAALALKADGEILAANLPARQLLGLKPGKSARKLFELGGGWDRPAFGRL